MRQLPDKQKQQGLVTLVVTLVILVALSILSVVGVRVALVKQRTATNNAEAIQAAAAADAGLQAGEAYLVAHKAQMASDADDGWLNTSNVMHWKKCSNSDISPPCGDGTNNIYGDNGSPDYEGDDWLYYGPMSNQPSNIGREVLPDLPVNDYKYKAWYLSNDVANAAAPTAITFPDNKCTGLFSEDPMIPLLGAVGDVVGIALDTVDKLLGGLESLLNPVLGGIVGKSDIIPDSLGLPEKLCLPVNLEQVPAIPPPSGINPTIRIIAQAQAKNGSTAHGMVHTAVAIQPTSLFNHIPFAAIMASNDADLVGDVQVWGNPRPPTEEPYDFSTINLDKLQPLGLPVDDLLREILDPVSEYVLKPLLSPLLDPILHDVLGTDTGTLLSLKANVTFPLSVWAGGEIRLLGEITAEDFDEPDTHESCEWWQIFCHLGNVIDDLIDALFGVLETVVDRSLDVVSGVLGPLLADSDSNEVDLNILLHSARTCLPAYSDDDECTPLSQTLTVINGIAEGTSDDNEWNINKSDPVTAVNVKLPDIQDEKSGLLGDDGGLSINTSGLLDFVADLLKGCTGSGCGPQFPGDLFGYTFNVRKSDLKQAAVNTSCDGVAPGANWISGNCTLEGKNGSVDDPIILVIEGDLTLKPGSEINGIIYSIGDGAGPVVVKSCEGDDETSCDRATIRGALLFDSGGAGVGGPINIIYDQNVIRKAGFMGGGFAQVPGSWNDSWDTLAAADEDSS